MTSLSFRRMGLFVFAVWVIWIISQVVIPDSGTGLGSGKAFAASDKTADGLGVYRQFCESCHGANGKGNDNMKKVMTMIPDFTDEKWQKEISDAQMSVCMTDGKGTMMPSFADKVTSDQVQALVEYIRKFDASRTK